MASELKYDFPHVSFNTSITGPVAFNSFWRNNIGVAATFTRGPQGPLRITSRQQFVSLYGEDSAPGSIFIRQAMLQGATNFVVRRVMPVPQKSYSNIALQSGSNILQDAFVSSVGDRTVGLTFQASYLSSAIIPPDTHLGETVEVSTARPEFPNFSGYGRFHFDILDSVNPQTLTVSPDVSLNVVNIADDIQVITASSTTAASLLQQYAKPGLVIQKATADTSPITLVSTYSPLGLEILTYPFESGSGVVGVLAKGTVTGSAAGTPSITNIAVKASTDPKFYILGYYYASYDGLAQPVPIAAPTKSYSTLKTKYQGFLVVPATTAWVPFSMLTLSNGTYALSSANAIQFRFGNPVNNVSPTLFPGTSFELGIVQGKVTVGETDSTVQGFASSPKAFSKGLSAAEILTQLRDKIARNKSLSALFEELTINSVSLPFNLSLESTFGGAESNRLYYRLDRTVSGGTPNDIHFGFAGALYSTWMKGAGGKDGMTSASRVLFDVNGRALVRIDALTPGYVGNNLKITVRPVPPGQFQIEIVDTTSGNYNTALPPEIFTLSNYSVDSQTGIYTATLESNLIRAYFLPVLGAFSLPLPDDILALTPQRLGPPIADVTNTQSVYHPSHRGVSYLSNLMLSGGAQPSDYNTSNPPEADVISAIRDLESEDIAVLSAPGVQLLDSRYEGALNEILRQTKDATPLNAYRIGVISCPPRLSESRAGVLAGILSSPEIVILSGFTTFAGARDLGVNAASPEGYYAGKLVTLPPHISPADGSSSGPINGVSSVDTKNSPVTLDALTRNHIEALYYDPGMRMYKFLNGVSSSTNPQYRYISVTRMLHQILMDLYINLQWIRSQPHTLSLRRQVASACDAYLKNLQRYERIFGYRATVCDQSNNTIDDIQRGRLNIQISYTPVYPADYVIVGVERDLTTDFTLQSSTG